MRRPGRFVKLAFSHTEEVETDKTWCWTLQFYDNDSADFVREALLFDLHPLMKHQETSLKQDQPSLEGGKLTREVREALNLPKPEKKSNKKTKKR